MSQENLANGPQEESISHWGHALPDAYKKALTPLDYKHSAPAYVLKGIQKAPVEKIVCPISQEVAKRVADRAEAGMKTYGVTMERKDVTTVGWIDHAIEEALDLAVYLTRLKRDLKQVGVA
jgi:hypothetical protein